MDGEKKLGCRECGWKGLPGELGRHTYREDWGDVDTVKCPGCGRVLWEGMELSDLFEEIEGEGA